MSAAMNYKRCDICGHNAFARTAYEIASPCSAPTVGDVDPRSADAPPSVDALSGGQFLTVDPGDLCVGDHLIEPGPLTATRIDKVSGWQVTTDAGSTMPLTVVEAELADGRTRRWALRGNDVTVYREFRDDTETEGDEE